MKKSFITSGPCLFGRLAPLKEETRLVLPVILEPSREKPCFLHMPKSKAQISYVTVQADQHCHFSMPGYYTEFLCQCDFIFSLIFSICE